MNKISTIFVRIRATEGGLLRILGLTVRRGFEVCNLQMMRSEGSAGHYDVIMQVRSNRPIHLLERQIAKLYDTVAVSTLWPAVGPHTCKHEEVVTELSSHLATEVEVVL